MTTNWFRVRGVLLGVGATVLMGVSVGAAKLTSIPLAHGWGLATAAAVYTPASRPPVSDAEATRAVASAKDLSTAFRVAADRVLPSLVSIETSVTHSRASAPARKAIPWQGRRNPFEGTPFEDMLPQMPFGEDFRFEFPEPGGQQHGIGSGVVFNKSGLIMTNSHVVAGGKQAKVLVRLADGREYTADEVWADDKTDIAVVKITAEDLVPAEFADSDQVAVGDWVLALGQPFGLEHTVTAGIISATHRGVGINARENFLQTDAAINPGNSGGPLVNLDGQVVGINTAISSRGGGNDGVGFAVPINVAHWVADQLASGGHVRRAYLGVGIQPIDADMAKQFGVKPREGVLVTDVYENTPAVKAGLKSGDVIVKYAGVAVRSPQELQMIVERSELGRRHELTVMRDGKTITLDFVPEEQPESFGGRPAVDDSPEPETRSSSALDDYGIEIGPADAELAKRLGVDNGAAVVITQVEAGSSAARAGLEAGMVVAEINRQPVANVDDCLKILKEHTADRDLLLLVKTDRGSRFVVLKP
jgi:serine protease Do